MKRRQFIGKLGSSSLFILGGGLSALKANTSKSTGEFVFIEAEGFEDYGGWSLDQQSMEQMGSPYLLAHGLGIPVDDAMTRLKFPSKGTYRVWVRTKDWVAPWNAPGTPGKFQLIVNNKALSETFGTKGATWHWHDGGTVSVDNEATVALHDLTGFEGRCEAILFSKDLDFEPSNELDALTKFRRKLLNLPDKPEDGGTYDLIIAGGDLAGTCTAISAARNGVKVALVQDRPVLGGNGSSEVRVWPEGHTNKEPFTHIGDIVNEILPPIERNGRVLNGVSSTYYDDSRKLDVVKSEPNITLMINHKAIEVETKGKVISSIIIQSTLTAKEIKRKALRRLYR